MAAASVPVVQGNVPKQVNEACLDFVLMQMVETIYKSNSDDPFTANSKLELIGYRVGQKLVERCTKDRPRFEEKPNKADKDLDIFKFVCKELWLVLTKKGVDGLKTNHRDKYVLTDNTFRWLRRLSSDSPATTEKYAERYIQFPRGILRGALNNLGLEADIKASSQ